MLVRAMECNTKIPFPRIVIPTEEGSNRHPISAETEASNAIRWQFDPSSVGITCSRTCVCPVSGLSFRRIGVDAPELSIGVDQQLH